ncbi:hypothetical protein JQW92_18125 [Sulfitobacter pseudonitzschiae]|uniref:hypothetical protein n=1 Tax=Pseudosulfitobacter pseudonitzschiae TaxID=1402135 RepID=UPI001AF9796B|nr:hypothetical protein [Pseudosulfitobacter pseudonitzschiae]MBM1834176.1 hypothetical protein [Pseudosulfitobacter pseudonitzschiae]MBM1839041.1 hypothetical protein [Pseudosulfitobacter pseudonitzschiae]MBM1858439.1 hypothetical protein [Pseudosulfitobacter pseudonitzschiae]MBM1863297.1 hypothetical protein [Pseudosulfitobacter pseudonitzschiae]MBM1872947.1 hypothetical protein [Pseudosulfitobacter pseudonitzschiae]
MNAMTRNHTDSTAPRKPFRVTIRGVTYQNAKAASEALGVTQETVYQARRRGTLDCVGMGKGNHTRHRGNSNGKPFTIGDHTWPSMRACSLDLGFYDGYVGGVMNRGSERQKRRLIRQYMEWVRSGSPTASGVAGEAGQ